MKEAEELTAQLHKQQQQSQQTAQELEQLRKVHTHTNASQTLARLRGPIQSSDWAGDGRPAATAAPDGEKESNSSPQYKDRCYFSISGDLHSIDVYMKAARRSAYVMWTQRLDISGWYW